jgi:predicted metalloprotease
MAPFAWPPGNIPPAFPPFSGVSTKNISRMLATALLTAAVSHASNAPLTVADEVAVQKKVDAAARYFQAVWAQIFASRGARYASPRLVSYTGSVKSGCGVLGSNNASYCGADNRIYYDSVFLTRMMKNAAEHLGTDGDYAPITVLAHEWGHAVQAQLDSASYIGLFRENMADCLAGAITQRANIDHHLDRGDLEEAKYALAMGGDKAGTTWVFDPNAHGSSSTRVGEFMKGFRGGVRACQVFETSRLGSAGDPASQAIRTFSELLQGLENTGR